LERRPPHRHGNRATAGDFIRRRDPADGDRLDSSQIATLLAEGDGGDHGLHSEMFTDGCMQLHP
jgi:hypothetical protein